MEAHNFIVKELKKNFPKIPILSEEGKHIPYEERGQWEEYWLVDPLDGTKEFINRNGEFTVNIALIKNGYPTAGVIYAPAMDKLYYASEEGSYLEKNGVTKKLFVSDRKNALICVISRTHTDTCEHVVLSKFAIGKKLFVGSSLKFCLIAEGIADIYYRHGPTMEWDTAAGQAIVENAGGIMIDMHNKRFSYNKPSLVNESFLCGNSSIKAIL